MKKTLLLILNIYLLGCNGNTQVKSEIDRAFEIVDQGIEKTNSDEYKEYLKNLSNSRNKEKTLLEQINISEYQIAIDASKLTIKYTYQIDNKINTIINELENAYTLDKNGNFNNRKDKSRINRIMIEDKKGKQLEDIIRKYSEKLKQLENSLKLKESNSLITIIKNIESPNNKSWAEYNFLDMPVNAAVPILKKIGNDVTLTRIEILESINKLTDDNH